MKYPWLHNFLLCKKGVEKDFKEEWQWTRYMLNGKLFAAVCKDENGNDALVTLKLPPQQGQFFREQYADIAPGYYMNKTHWNSVNLNGSVPDSILKELLDTSYALILSALPKKVQKQIESL